MKTSNCSKKIPFFLLFFDEGWYPPLFSNSWGGVERWMGGVEGGRGEGVQRRGEGHFSSRPVIRGRGRVMALLSPYTLPNHSHFSPPTHLSCYFPFLFIFLFLRSMCILYPPLLFPSDLFVSFIPISSCHEICLHPSSPSSFFRSVYTLFPQIFQISVHPLFLHFFIFLCALFLSKYLFSLCPHTFFSLYKKHTYFFLIHLQFYLKIFLCSLYSVQ